ncbi:uncharacterized protein LOC132756012 [Ruditapes philippinarum]|uniref:uncharacterized protein LOC132756012 n=1 Tax=Ruditapes philippinarum TaxID=129788 RepID=UPI00295C21DF|nr:uncharacterized protein LOC132756012 [Ruditapes philippinarum]
MSDIEDNDDDMEKSHAMMEALKMKLCEVFDNFDICQNGGTCQIGSGESFWEVCKCPTGFSGLFCETTGAVSPRDTMCNRDRQRISTISAIMMGSEHMKEKMVLQEMFNRFKPPQNIMSTYTCDAAGNYQQIQMGTTLPKTLHSIQIYYCVDTDTGMRIRGTPVTMVDSGVMPDCTITTALPDIMGLPRICMVRNTTRCSNGDECQYFWNQEEGTCDKGKAMGGFNRLTDCYDKCSIQKGCTNDPNGDRANTDGFVCQKGVISGPKPCRMEDSNGAEYDTCDYERQFCEVEDTASGHIGMCKTFPRRCLDGPESGYGGRTVGAYYFNTKTRTCKKFLYRGMGGNLNRYYHLKQCHTECSTRMYKYDDAVCPIPKMLEMSMDEVSNCDSDEDCEGVSVCCFNGKGRICTNPVRTCSSGLRCSLFGSCSGDQCVCDDCTDIPLSQVK